jgi:hypothetical protein
MCLAMAGFGPAGTRTQYRGLVPKLSCRRVGTQASLQAPADLNFSLRYKVRSSEAANTTSMPPESFRSHHYHSECSKG